MRPIQIVASANVDFDVSIFVSSAHQSMTAHSGVSALHVSALSFPEKFTLFRYHRRVMPHQSQPRRYTACFGAST